MQVVRRVNIDAETYLATSAHLRIRRPMRCPHCRRIKCMNALGFYCRSATAIESGRVVRIFVRRFMCVFCRRTVSLLPSFAQPYRLLCNATIEWHFNEGVSRADTLRWHLLLRRYWNRFIKWLPDLVNMVGRVFSLPPPHAEGSGSWQALMAAYGRLDRATVDLVRQFQVTAFGKYRCHSPVPPVQ
jgi:hypothetical protein